MLSNLVSRIFSVSRLRGETLAAPVLMPANGITRRNFVLGLGGVVSAVVLGIKCGGETEPLQDAGVQRDRVPNCPPVKLILNAQNVDAFAFNGASSSLIVDNGQEVLQFNSQTAKDPGVAVLPKNADAWSLSCHTRLTFEIKGQIALVGAGNPELDVQIYLDGDDPAKPSIRGFLVPFTGDWSLQEVFIDPALIGGSRKVIKIQPLAIGNVSSVDLYFRNLQFE